MAKDNRDPEQLGVMLEQVAALDRAGGNRCLQRPLSEVYDRNEAMLQLVPNHEADPSTLEKYGDPRVQGDLWVATHMPVAA